MSSPSGQAPQKEVEPGEDRPEAAREPVGAGDDRSGEPRIFRGLPTGMESRFYYPHPLLRDLVHCIMVVHARLDAGDGPGICLYPPTPQPSLFFYLDDPIKVRGEGSDRFITQPRSVVVGQQSKRVCLDVGHSHRAVRVGFLPGGLHRLLGLPMWELLDGNLDAEDVFGPDLRDVNDSLLEVHDMDDIRSVVERFLLVQLRRVKPYLPFDRAMAELLAKPGCLSMDRAAGLACLSIRQFERVSQQRLGMSPKGFARVVRFSRAYRMREEYPDRSWTEIAYRCDYFDQMHMIRDFKEFAGVSPGRIERELHHAPFRLQADLRL